MTKFSASVQIKKIPIEAQRTVLSFQGYLEEAFANPLRHIRNAAQYFQDMVAHFGTDEKNTQLGLKNAFVFSTVRTMKVKDAGGSGAFSKDFPVDSNFVRSQG